MHLAEQVAKVTEAQNALNARPVGWLVDHKNIQPELVFDPLNTDELN